jgi:hypothetical protein
VGLGVRTEISNNLILTNSLQTKIIFHTIILSVEIFVASKILPNLNFVQNSILEKRFFLITILANCLSYGKISKKIRRKVNFVNKKATTIFRLRENTGGGVSGIVLMVKI